jgi:hypothetical protein
VRQFLDWLCVYPWPTDFPKISRLDRITCRRQPKRRARRPQPWQKMLGAVWAWLCGATAYRWTSGFTGYSSRGAQARPFPKSSTVYAQAVSSVSARRRQPAWRQALRGWFDWLCTNARYRWSTDFPQFSSAHEPQQIGALGSTWSSFVGICGATLQGPAKALGGVGNSLVRQLARRFRGRVFSGLLALLFLLPVPLYAAITFGPWVIQSQNNQNVINATPNTTGDTLTFTISAQTTPLPADLTITGNGNANWDGNNPNTINATFKNWNTLNGTGNVNFQVKYNGTPLFLGADQSLGALSNQFSGTAQSLINKGSDVPIEFDVILRKNSTWSVPSSTVTVVFTSP